MIHRRRLLQIGTLGISSIMTTRVFASKSLPSVKQGIIVKKPLVISTWDAGINANKAAWEILKKNGRALDAVETRALDVFDVVRIPRDDRASLAGRQILVGMKAEAHEIPDASNGLPAPA